MKEKRIKKKIGKRKISEETNSLSSDNMKIEIENSNCFYSDINNNSYLNPDQSNISNYTQLNNNINSTNINQSNLPSSEKSNKLDFFIKGVQSLEGIKGHTNFYSIKPIQSGTFYFEIKIKSLSFNIIDWINQKRIDDFSKKYYDNVLVNPKSYVPNIRVGLSHYKCDLELPVGSDVNSYCYKANDGLIITEGEVKGKNKVCVNDDIIGVLVKIKPPMPDFLKAKILENEEKNSINSECYLKFFINGVEQPDYFIGLCEGDYHIVITLYNFAQAEIDFGNKLRYFDKIPQGLNASLLNKMK